jgi:RimJ/RimL family protein N-acetyltransferase
VHHFISGVAPDNGPSLRVNEKLGFVDTGQVVDGERIFELRWPADHAAAAGIA